MRKKIIIIILFFLFIGFLFPKKIQAHTKISGESAKISSFIKTDDSQNLYLFKQLVIKKIFLKYHSPLVDVSNVFVDVCLKYGFDCYLLPAIAGVESSFGRFVFPNSYNPFGWGGGYIIFKNWKEGIEKVAKYLKENYIDKGATNLWLIGKIYAPYSSTWSEKVDFLIKEFYNEEEKYVKL